MSRIIFQFPTMNIPTGVFTIPETPTPGPELSMTLALARCTTATPLIWPLAITTIDVTMQASYDGGATYFDAGGFTAEGGIAIGHGGVERTNTYMTLTFDQSPTHYKGTVTVANGPMRTSGVVSVA